MIGDTIKTISEAKVSGSGILIAGSGSAMTFGVVSVTYQDVIFGFAGLLVSVFSFYYEYTHPKTPSESKTKHQIASEMIRHLIFGTFAFPAVYSLMDAKFNFSFAINIFIAVVVSYSIMKFVGVGIGSVLGIIKGTGGRS